MGVCRYENAAGGAGRSLKRLAQDSEKLAYRRYVEERAKSLLCRNMYNKKDAGDLAASFLSFAKSGGVFQQSEKVFPVRFLQHGIDCIIQLGFLCIVK